jgi:ubiquinone/menaquinone biosynthesis C-methylase UbiE
MDPLAGSPWSTASTVAGFVASSPNATLMAFAERRLVQPGLRALDIGCGAARNLLPLAEQGWDVVGVDLSRPMLAAAAERTHSSAAGGRITLAMAGMDALPMADASVDLIVAHGIWNLARSGAEFRAAVQEAARVARPDAALFVFTFSRRTLPTAALPVPGETFVYTQFSGQPQVFLTADQLTRELSRAGFTADPAVPLTEHNVPRTGSLTARGVPVIFEAAYRYTR